MRRNTARVISGGEPVNWLGANFWSRTGGPLMWRSYDPAVVAGELSVLKEHGLTMTRSFFYWPDFMPGPREIDDKMTARFKDFLDRHAELGMTTIPTFIVGHMSGENWDPAWRNGRDLYADVWMVGRQAWFAREMVQRYKDHPAVAGWLVSNEMPIYGGSTTGHEIVATWAQLIRDAVRAAGGRQPFSLGDGAWGIEVTGTDNGFRLADIAGLTDFLGPHVYPVGDDPIRQKYAAALACELAGTFGKPVIMEEFGVSSDFASDSHAAALLPARAVQHAARRGDRLDRVEQHRLRAPRPGPVPAPRLRAELRAYRRPRHAEGDAQGNARVRRDSDGVGHTRCERADTDTALIVSGYLDTMYPFVSPEAHVAISKALHQGYLAARLADLPPG